ncbi:nucleotide-binding protein [Thiohalobacter thiocyanaticus]|uniref:7-methyl-GTP pyrophosphatase n=1 Tax=Thiohalobacter thiocyanaticus TaxID=585455 RepID=A0A1Z4VRU6_9GAMM|nr:nucleoside triphosphate pyrophosphatase [Thiohalobacter thiocyanaticus]BAZ94213.1 nucleotide-binding protein [Thiohalobacter thiocyanaticus]
MSNPASPEHTLVLGSSSPFRRELLARLGLPFECHSPDIDESARPGESPRDLVARLSEAKARAVAAVWTQALIIGSDQVAVVDEEILGKPGSHERAREQLSRLSGREVTFLTGLCLYNSESDRVQLDVVPYSVEFRDLSAEQIERYLEQEQPYNCAGSFRSEALGVTLFRRMQGDDPNALVGLPLIRLVDMLAEEGVGLP